jgi:hypothetical protein
LKPVVFTLTLSNAACFKLISAFFMRCW